MAKTKADAASDSHRMTSVDYRPNPNVHVAEAGDVARSNWIGLVKGRRVRVYRGAQRKGIPEGVLEAIGNEIKFGPITFKELGLKPPAGYGAHVEVQAGHKAQGANLLG